MQDQPFLAYALEAERKSGRQPEGGERISLFQVWAWLMPWVGHLLFAASGIFGLFAASGGAADRSYVPGLVTFVLAVVVLALRIKRHADGKEDTILGVLVSGADALLLYIVVLGAFGIGGLLLAAASKRVLHNAGLAFFVFCTAFIFASIKHHFDLREQEAPPD